MLSGRGKKLKGELMNEKLIFALIVENFDDVKSLNKKDTLKAFELFKQKLDEINKKTSKPARAKSLKVDKL